MRILLVSYEYPPLGGGGGVAAAHYARAWVRRGHEVTVLTSGAPGLAPHELDGGVQVYRVAIPGRTRRATASLVSLLAYPALALRFARRWGHADFDVVNSFFAVPSGVAGALLARRWGRPHVVSLMGGDVYDPSKPLSPHRTPLLKQTVAAVLRGADQVSAISHDLVERATRIYGLRKPVAMIPIGLQLPEPKPQRDAGGPVTIITVARLVRRKLHAELIAAVAALPPGLARLVIVGDGPQRGELETLVARLGLQGRVTFTGFVSDEEKYTQLRAAHIFALVSEHEGFGLVYLEAASQRLPIVAATVGGQVDFLEHGRTGWLVPARDQRQLTAALAALATQPALRARLGEQALQVARRYHVDVIADQHLQVLYDVQNAHP